MARFTGENIEQYAQQESNGKSTYFSLKKDKETANVRFLYESAEDIAEMFNYERSYLHRLFKERYGMTVKQYMTEVRMRQAKRLLKAGHSVIETAYQTGYGNEFNFSKAFKKFFGVPPSAMKPKQMNKKELNKYDVVIIDEDIISSSIITNQCEIPITTLKKVLKKVLKKDEFSCYANRIEHLLHTK